MNNFKSKSSFENIRNITDEENRLLRTSNSNLFGGSSSDDFTSDVSANAAAASGMIAILNYAENILTAASFMCMLSMH